VEKNQPKTFILKVYRGVPGHQFWEEFELELKPFYNIIAALIDIQKNPLNRKQEKTTPIAWEQGCLEEVCGSCSILVNGRPRQACTSLIQPIIDATGSRTIVIAPMTKFPLVKDLVVNRDRMFQNLLKVKAWIQADDALDRGFGPRISPQVQEARYVLSTCMTCGCCTEACPQINSHSKFIGPATISQVRLFNSHPIGKLIEGERMRPMMEEGGVTECGNAQNCAAVCPKDIPLTESIAWVGRKVVKQALKESVGLPDS
jgi:succinate dehydrogenase / fumarate reductase iron-sulfur subunit